MGLFGSGNVTTGEVEADLKGYINHQDSSQVISRSDDQTVQMCNAVTADMQLMTASTITLPDASIVHSVGQGDFYISYPEQPILSIHGPLSITDDK